MINPNLKLPKEKLAAFCRRYRVKRLSLFGSATRTDFGPESDVDVLVEFQEDARVGLFGLVTMKDELSEMLGNRPVDLATPSILRNPFRRKTILRDLETIYAA